jgi:hypothetical protein
MRRRVIQYLVGRIEAQRVDVKFRNPVPRVVKKEPANVIAPALIETEMVTSNPNASPERIPVGRYGAVDEVAEVAVMLARNGYITGQTINVNGGWFMS